MASPQKRFYRPAAAEPSIWDRKKLEDLSDNELLILCQKLWRVHTDMLLYGRSRLELTDREASMLKGE
jgi:hypothetical protein